MFCLCMTQHYGCQILTYLMKDLMGTRLWVVKYYPESIGGCLDRAQLTLSLFTTSPQVLFSTLLFSYWQIIRLSQQILSLNTVDINKKFHSVPVALV